MAKQKDEQAPGHLTRRQLADAFGVHMMTVTGWEQEGMPVAIRGSRGRPSYYALKDCNQWWIERELKARGVAAGVSSAPNPNQERALLDQKRREDLELRMEIKRGKLVDLETVEREFADAAVAVKARLRRIPDAIAEQVVKTGTQLGAVGVKALLLEALDDALRELARTGSPQEFEEAS